MSVSGRFVSEAQTTQPPTVIISHIVTEKMCLLFNVELSDGHCDALFADEEKID